MPLIEEGKIKMSIPEKPNIGSRFLPTMEKNAYEKKSFGYFYNHNYKK